MDIPHLINEFASRGVTLWLDEGKLKFRAANGALSAEDKEFLDKQMRVVLRHCGLIDPESIDDYIAVGGYEATKKVVSSSVCLIFTAFSVSKLPAQM